MSKILKWPWRALLIGAAGLLLLGICLAALFNAKLTRYVESNDFRVRIGEETAKGLHLATGTYEPIRRTGAQTVASGGFTGGDGVKTIRSLTAHALTAKFDPWGILLRRWQLDEVRIGSGEVEIQIYEPKPEVKPAKPWYTIFLPDRVYLVRVVSEPVDVMWRFRKAKGGFFGTRLLITPHGRDFDYYATGGTMKIASLPELRLANTHLLVTRQLLTVYNLDIAPGEQSEGSIHVKGTAGLREEKGFDAEMNFSGVPVAAWLPESIRRQVSGIASGEARVKGKQRKLQDLSGNGALQITGGRLTGLQVLEKIAALTGKESLKTLNFSTFSVKVEGNHPRIGLQDIDIEDKGKLRIEGSVMIDGHNLNGTVRLGTTPEYLTWLPNAEEVFSRRSGAYMWTTVKLEGTVENPKQDLIPRIVKTMERSPEALLGIFFRETGDWLRSTFGE